MPNIMLIDTEVCGARAVQQIMPLHAEVSSATVYIYTYNK